jgi:hypothetical protein
LNLLLLIQTILSFAIPTLNWWWSRVLDAGIKVTSSREVGEVDLKAEWYKGSMTFSAETATAASSLLIALFLGAVLSTVYTKSVAAWAQWVNLVNALAPQALLLAIINNGPVTTSNEVLGVWIIVGISGLLFSALIGVSGAEEYKKSRQAVNASRPAAYSGSTSHVVRQVILKKRGFRIGRRNEARLAKAINAQVARGYRLQEFSTASSGGADLPGGNRLQAVMVFERLRWRAPCRFAQISVTRLWSGMEVVEVVVFIPVRTPAGSAVDVKLPDRECVSIDFHAPAFGDSGDEKSLGE